MRKFIHNKHLTPKERQRLVRWLQARRRERGEAPIRQLPDGRYSLLDLA
jgi:hypothetical protein